MSDDFITEALEAEGVAADAADDQADNGGREDGAALLGEIEALHRRMVAYPSEAARVAAVLWCAHAHAVEAFESTPRLALLSPEAGSGKTRALELIATLVPNPMHAVNATPAALFRRVADRERPVTVLFDEIDTVFGPKAKENEELRALLNAGHRRSGVAYRCVGEGTKQQVVEFPAFAPLAVAGLGDLPDTILTRSVIVRMRRRAPSERVEPFRARVHEPIGHALRDRLARWAKAHERAWAAATPDMPEGVTDRPADVWEPLLAVADTAGGSWPQRAREACVALTSGDVTNVSLGVQLLADLREVFGDRDAMFTDDLLAGLHALEESPWADLRGKALDARGLAFRLRQYEVSPTTVRIGDDLRKGYRREDLWDPWQRYLSPPDGGAVTSVTSDTATPETPTPGADRGVTAEDRQGSLLRQASVTPPDAVTGNSALTSGDTGVTAVTAPQPRSGHADAEADDANARMAAQTARMKAKLDAQLGGGS